MKISKKDDPKHMWLPFLQGVIPMTPVSKGRPRSTKKGRVYTPAKTKKAEEVIRLYLRNRWKEKPIEGVVGLGVTFISPRPKSLKGNERELRPKKPDTDNLYKLFCDGANGIIYTDDSMVCMHQMTDWYAAPDEDPKIIFEATYPIKWREGLHKILDAALSQESIYVLASDMGLSWRTLHRWKKKEHISDQMKALIEKSLLTYDITHTLW